MGLRSLLLGTDDKPQLNGHRGPQFGIEIPFEIVEGDRLAGSSGRISRKKALEVPAVLRARNLIAGTLARLPIHIRNEQREIESPTTLLDQIDPDVPNVVVLASTYEDLLFEGISWWRITDFDLRGFPSQARHISVDRVLVMSGRVYIDGQPVSDDQVIRFDSPNPPLLVCAAQAIRTCRQLDRTAAMYSDALPPLGAFTPKEGAVDLGEEEIQDLLDRWETARKQRAWAYVGAAWEMKDLGFDAEQIQLADQRNHAVLEIARAAGIDPEDLGVSTTTRTYQNSEQRRQDLLDFTLATYTSAVEQRLSMRDVLPVGFETKVNFDGFLRSDTKTRMETYKIGKEVGAYSEPEIRELEDRPPLPEGSETSTPRELAELIQKIYLGVGVVLTAEEARDIANRAGAGLEEGVIPSQGATR